MWLVVWRAHETIVITRLDALKFSFFRERQHDHPPTGRTLSLHHGRSASQKGPKSIEHHTLLSVRRITSSPAIEVDITGRHIHHHLT